MMRILPFAVLLAGLVSSQASAQSTTAAPVLKDKEAEHFNEIERGFYFGVAAGPSFIVKPPSDSGPRPFASGQTVELELGSDFGSHLAVSLFVRGSQFREDASYYGNGSPLENSGDFSTLMPGASARFKFGGFEDSQKVARTWFYVRGGVGYTLFYPAALKLGSDILVFAGPGIEYYTRLRHFSIGVEAVGSLLVGSKSFGFAVTPNLRYAF